MNSWVVELDIMNLKQLKTIVRILDNKLNIIDYIKKSSAYFLKTWMNRQKNRISESKCRYARLLYTKNSFKK